jgi:hypothetical protein
LIYYPTLAISPSINGNKEDKLELKLEAISFTLKLLLWNGNEWKNAGNLSLLSQRSQAYSPFMIIPLLLRPLSQWQKRVVSGSEEELLPSLYQRGNGDNSDVSN